MKETSAEPSIPHFSCSRCAKIFTKKEHLSRHERAHTGEKPFPCPVCGKCFARKDVYLRHKRTHISATDSDGVEASEIPNPTSLNRQEQVFLDKGQWANTASTSGTTTSLISQHTNPSQLQPSSRYEDVALLTHLSADTGWHTDISTVGNDQSNAHIFEPDIGSFPNLSVPSVDNLAWETLLQPDYWQAYDYLWQQPTAVEISDDPAPTQSTEKRKFEQTLRTGWVSRPSLPAVSRPASPNTNIDCVVDEQERLLGLTEGDTQELQRFMQANVQDSSIEVLPDRIRIQTALDHFVERSSLALPFLHIPSLTPRAAGVLVLAACTAVGLYGMDPQLHDRLAIGICSAVLRTLIYLQSPVMPHPVNCPPQSPLQICQAGLLCCHLSLLGCDPTLMASCQLFHATLVDTASRGSILKAETVVIADSYDGLLDKQWRRWVAVETNKRTAYSITQVDRLWAQFYMIMPLVDGGCLFGPLPCSDAAWAATTATAWLTQVKLDTSATVTLANCEMPVNFNDMAGMLLHEPVSTISLLPDLTGNCMACEALMGSLCGVVLGSKKLKPRVLTLQANELLPLETALKAAEKLVKMAGPKDVMFIGVSWNAAWLHLLANMRFIEIVCGREGYAMAQHIYDRLLPWSVTRWARFGLLHAVDISRRLSCVPLGSEITPLAQISAYQAWMYLFAFERLQGSTTIPYDFEWSDLLRIPMFTSTSSEALGDLSARNDCTFVLNGLYTSSVTDTAVKTSRVIADLERMIVRMGSNGMNTKFAQMFKDIRQLFSS